MTTHQAAEQWLMGRLATLEVPAINGGVIPAGDDRRPILLVSFGAVGDRGAQGQRHTSSFVAQVMVHRGTEAPDYATAALVDGVLHDQRGLEDGFSIHCERVQEMTSTQVDSGRTFRQTGAQYRLDVSTPVGA